MSLFLLTVFYVLYIFVQFSKLFQTENTYEGSSSLSQCTTCLLKCLILLLGIARMVFFGFVSGNWNSEVNKDRK